MSKELKTKSVNTVVRYSKDNQSELNPLTGYKVRAEHNGVCGELSFIGEGINGEYQANDSEDHPLLRLELFTITNDTNEPVLIECSSCCTQLSVYDDNSLKNDFLKKILIEVYNLIKNAEEGGIRKLIEHASFQPSQFVFKML